MQFREKYNILYKMFHVELFKASLVQREVSAKQTEGLL